MKFAAAFAALGLLLAVTATAGATQIWDQPGYVPSSALVLGAPGYAWDGIGSDNYDEIYGNVIADPFQINLLYQPGILNSDIDAINAYAPGTGWTYNFSDNDQYVFACDMGGGLPVYTYSDEKVIDPNIQWTLTGWNQTIFAGTIVDEGGSLFFQVDPSLGYRSFPADPPVNDVEVFGGIVLSEVVGYRYNGTSCPGEGAVLEAELVPEPVTLAGLALGVGSLVGYVRRRRKS